APTRVSEILDGRRPITRSDPIFVHEQNSRARSETGPGPVRGSESRRDAGGRRRGVGNDEAALDEQKRTHGIAGPEYVRLRALALGYQAVQHARALRLLRVVDGTHGEATAPLELLEYRLGEDLIDRCVDDDFISRR